MKKRIPRTRQWSEYPLGTKAHCFQGGYWTRVVNGWQAMGGDIFPTPGATAIGECIELPVEDEDERKG